MVRDRFIDSTFLELQEDYKNPLDGYQNLPVLSLDKAVEKIIPFVPDTEKYISQAKEKCNRTSTKLTLDESAAIYLYTMSTSFFSNLNTALRNKDRDALELWFPFLKLFMAALEKLPSTKTTVWRGVNCDPTSTFPNHNVDVWWWAVSSCSKYVHSAQPFLGECGTLFLIDAIHGKDISAFSAFPDEQEVILMPGTCVQLKSKSLNFMDRPFIVHLAEKNLQRESQTESSRLVEEIKQKYQQNNRIPRIMNASKSFSIGESYINLAIVNTLEHREKEKQLCDAQNSSYTIIDAFEEIYGMKTAIEIKNIFNKCKNQDKQVLVFGRAGIGKSTFCQFIAYQWATGSYWSQYELLILIPLCCLTANQYPPLSPGQNYSLIDLIKKEAFQGYHLTEKDERLLASWFDTKKILWVLDGYDEIIQNVAPHLEGLFEQLLKTPHHILTARPHMNTLSYDVEMEITGFTDEDIENYVVKFFDQIKDELNDAPIKSKKLLNFLKSNSSVWGIAHIPLHLDLICSHWSNEDVSETEHITITMLYKTIIEWSFRRYLPSTNKQIQQLSGDEVNQHCRTELTFLENLAIHAMKNNLIIIRPASLKTVMNETKVFSQDYIRILGIGILKSFNKQGVGTSIETSKDCYFVHPSFQAYFASQYLINTLNGPTYQEGIDFIKREKYNQRYSLLFIFASGLLSDGGLKPCWKIFHDTLFGEPLDLVGIRHIQLIISCIEETTDKSAIPWRTELLQLLLECIKCNIFTENRIVCRHLSQSLQRAQSVTCHPIIIDGFVNLLQNYVKDKKAEILSFISRLNISNPSSALITSVTSALQDEEDDVRQNACIVLGNINEKALTNNTISELVSLLEDKNVYVTLRACETLCKIGKKKIINKVISKLVSLLENENVYVRLRTCQTLSMIGGKAATNEVIPKLVRLLADENMYVSRRARQALEMMGGEAVPNEVINNLIMVVTDENKYVNENACLALEAINEETTTNEVITKLVSALEDQNESVRVNACIVLWKIGEKAATKEVISKLGIALKDENKSVRENAHAALWKINGKSDIHTAFWKIDENVLTNALANENVCVRGNACIALEQIDETLVTDEMINKLVNALGDENACIRGNACIALEQIDETLVTDEMINKLANALGDENAFVRGHARVALEHIGEKVIRNKVIDKLTNALDDENINVKGEACIALGNIGKQAATNEVIRKLMNALNEENKYVSWSAAGALGKMGEKAATNEVIRELEVIVNRDIHYLSDVAAEAVGRLLSSSNVMKQLSPKLIFDLCLSKHGSVCLKTISVNQLINIFFTTENPEWLSTVTVCALLKEAAVTDAENSVVVYEREERKELPVRNAQLRQQLIKAFTDQAKQQKLFFKMTS